LTEGESCVLSASCILNNITFDVIINAETETEIFLLNVGTFSKLNNENIYVENFSYKNAVDRFSDVMWAMEQILFMSFDKRLATFLIDETAKTKTTDINLTHDQIAKYLGSAREVVSRMLKNFEAQGILKLSRGLIQIIDKDKLKKILI
jgi:CRP/FNR family transcriptional regulator